MPDPRQLSLDFTLPDDDAADTLVLEPKTKSSPAPIPYSIKVSSRARQVYLRAVPGRGLVVTIPKRFPKRDVPEIIESQRSWVEQALADLAAQVPQEFRNWPPHSLTLVACECQFDIEYTAQRGNVARARWLSETKLLIEADVDDRVAVASCLAAVLKDRAKKVLGPWLARLASSRGFEYKRLVVRGQRSVWGSYSSSGTLSLNYKLLFLQPRLVDYVLLHELAHTRHLDHSAAFWDLLERQMEDAREIDKELHDAGKRVPPWLELAV